MDPALRERALLLAALGCYDDALVELAGAVETQPEPAADDPALALLRAQIALAAGRAPLVLELLAGAPEEVAVLSTRAMALIDLRRFRDAARLGTDILDGRATDVDALCAGAGVLAVARNGPRALSAAWDAVRLAPEESRTHLVLGLVAAGLGQYELAARAYAEALEREPDLDALADDPGVARLELRRQHRALEHLLGLAAAGTSLKTAPDPAGPPPVTPPVAGPRRRPTGPAAAGGPSVDPAPPADRASPTDRGPASGDRGPAPPDRGPKPAATRNPARADLARLTCGIAAGAGLTVLLGLPVLGDAAALLAALAAAVVAGAAGTLWWRAGRPGRRGVVGPLGAVLTAVALAAGAAGAGWWPAAVATAAALLLAWRGDGRGRS